MGGVINKSAGKPHQGPRGKSPKSTVECFSFSLPDLLPQNRSSKSRRFSFTDADQARWMIPMIGDDAQIHFH